MSLFCQACGSPNATDARFCNQCGAQIAAAGQPGGPITSNPGVAPSDVKPHSVWEDHERGKSKAGSSMSGPLPSMAGEGLSTAEQRIVPKPVKIWPIVAAVGIGMLSIGGGGVYFAMRQTEAEANQVPASDPVFLEDPVPVPRGVEPPSPGRPGRTGANANGANVRGPGTGANVREPGTGANVTGATTTGANPTGANPTGANPTGANVGGTTSPANTGTPRQTGNTETTAQNGAGPNQANPGSTGSGSSESGSQGSATTGSATTGGSGTGAETTGSTGTEGTAGSGGTGSRDWGSEEVPDEQDMDMEMYGVQARRVIRSYYAPRVQRCWDHESRNAPEAVRGTVLVSFVVGASGQVQNATVVRNSTGIDRLGTCLTNEVNTWRLPQPPGGELEMQMPFSR